MSKSDTQIYYTISYDYNHNQYCVHRNYKIKGIPYTNSPIRLSDELCQVIFESFLKDKKITIHELYQNTFRLLKKSSYKIEFLIPTEEDHQFLIEWNDILVETTKGFIEDFGKTGNEECEMIYTPSPLSSVSTIIPDLECHENKMSDILNNTNSGKYSFSDVISSRKEIVTKKTSKEKEKSRRELVINKQLYTIDNYAFEKLFGKSEGKYYCYDSDCLQNECNKLHAESPFFFLEIGIDADKICKLVPIDNLYSNIRNQFKEDLYILNSWKPQLCKFDTKCHSVRTGNCISKNYGSSRIHLHQIENDDPRFNLHTIREE